MCIVFRIKPPLPNFLCGVFWNDLLPSICEICTLMNYQMSINVFHSKRIRMCFRFQRYNHSSDVSTLEFSCVKCVGNHPSREYHVPRKLIKCANSQTTGYEGTESCKFYTETWNLRCHYLQHHEPAHHCKNTYSRQIQDFPPLPSAQVDSPLPSKIDSPLAAMANAPVSIPQALHSA